MPPYSLVILDFDGTLADSADWVFAQFNDLAPKFGFRTIQHDEAEALRRLSTRQILSRLNIPMWKTPFLAHALRRRAATADIQLFPGIDVLLRDLHAAGVTLAVVSSNSEANIRRILGPLAGLVSAWHCGRSLFGKGQALAGVVRRLKAPPSRVLCVGDEERDIEAAHGAGLACAAVSWGYAHPDALLTHSPDHVVHTIADLHDLIIGNAAP